MEKEPSYIVGGNVNWCSHYGKQHASSAKKLKSFKNEKEQSRSWEMEGNCNSERYMHPNVRSSTIHSSQDMEGA